MRELTTHAHDFSLFQAVDLIQRWSRQPNPALTGAAAAVADGYGQRLRVRGLGAPGPQSGTSSYVAPSEERVRFRGVGSMGFPASDVARISVDDSGSEATRYVVETACLGLYGPDSPLPDYINELIAAHDRDAGALREFLDLFHHRLMVLLCRIAQRYRHAKVFDFDATDEISLLCGALIGELDPFEPMPDPGRPHRLRNAPLLGLFNLSAAHLQQVLADRFDGAAVRVEEFVPHRASIDHAQRWRLGEQASRLNEDALLGDWITAGNGRIRLWIGPLDSKQLTGFVPGGTNWRSLRDLLARLLSSAPAWELALRVRREAAQPLALAGADGRQGLGQTAWLGQSADESVVHFAAAA